MYSLKNVLQQSPEEIKGGILLVLSALVLTGVISVSTNTAVAWGIAIERLLGWFYVKPLTINKAQLAQVTSEVDSQVNHVTDQAAQLIKAVKPSRATKKAGA